MSLDLLEFFGVFSVLVDLIYEGIKPAFLRSTGVGISSLQKIYYRYFWAASRATLSLRTNSKCLIVWYSDPVHTGHYKEYILFKSIKPEASPKMQTVFQHAVVSLPKQHALFLWLKLNGSLKGDTAKDIANNVYQRLRAHECTDNALGFGPLFYKKIGGNQDVDFTYGGWSSILPPRAGDIFVHGKSDSQGVLYQLTRDIMDGIPKDSVDQYEDIYGFTIPGPYGYDRDESGFIDGTRNPNTPAARINVAVTQNGGSFGVAQKWIHDFEIIKEAKSNGILSEWIGRDVNTGAVLGDRPEAAHIVRVKQDQIVRQSLPYGNYKESGLFFLAYANTPSNFNTLLDNMAGTKGPMDLILQTGMSSNKTGGAYFYFPGKKEMDDVFKK